MATIKGITLKMIRLYVFYVFCDWILDYYDTFKD